MKICFLLGGFYSGGIGRVVSILANELCKNEKNEVHAVTLRPAAKKEIYKLDDRILRSYLVDDNRPVKYVFFSALKRYRQYLKINKIDISIACGNIFYLLALLSKDKSTKVICWEHSNVYTTSDNQGQTLFRLIASKFADEVVTLTDSDKEGYEKKFKAKRVKRIYNPIDPQLDSEVAYDVNSKKILSVGRLCYQKHFEVIPDIALELNKYQNDWVWEIYGSGDAKENIEKEIAAYNLEDKVKLKGQVGDLYKRYKQYSMIVMTSRYEGFPMTLLEGAANGLPMISYDIHTGPDEIIDDGENGFLLKEGDIKGMAKQISYLLQNQKARTEFSKKSFETAMRFNVKNIVDEWLLLLDKLLRA